MGNPKVIGEYETITRIIERGASIARYGDGEIKLCRNRNQMSQIVSKRITERLRGILRSQDPNLLVGIPNIWNEEKNPLSERKENFWCKYRRSKNMKFYKKGKQYYSAFITRPDAALHIDNDEYWLYCKRIWFDRNVVLIKGEGTGFDKDPTIFMGAKSVEAIIAPKRDAFESLKNLLRHLTLYDLYDRSTLFIISLGPAATILAADLCTLGYQALDLGHFGMMYSKAHHYYNKGEKFWDVPKKTTDK